MSASKHALKIICLSFLLTSSLVVGVLRRRAAAEAETVSLLRWPYLQQVTSRSAHIIWTTDWKGSPSLEYGIGSAYRPVGIISRSISTPDGVYFEHRAVLQDLQPNTWYYYRTFDNGVNLTPSGKRWFQTAPLAGAFTFAAFGDSGAGTPEQYQVRDRMWERWRDIQLFIHTGDLAYPDGSYAEFRRFFFEVYQSLLTWRPIFPTMGNHEYHTDSGRPYLDLFDLPMTALALRDMEHYYSFDWGNAHFVSLNSEDPLRRIDDSSDTDMVAWLSADLENDNHFWKIAFIHRPLYSSCPNHPETDVRQKLAPILESYGVDLVLTGHNHNYERTHPIRDGQVTSLKEGGIVHITTGGGGATLYPVPGDWFTAAKAKTHHFVQVDVTKCAMILTAIDKEGTVIDQAVLDKCPHQTYLPVVP